MNAIKSITFILLITPMISYSQLDYPLFVENQTWEIKEEWFSENTLYDFIVGNDTIIEGKVYKRMEPLWIYHDDDVFGYEENNRAFLRTTDTTEYLLYDFNLNLEDTFYLYNPYTNDTESFAIVTNIDEVYMSDGVARKRMILSLSPDNVNDLPYMYCFDNYMEWIDGIGSTKHPLYTLMNCFETLWELECFYYSDESTYGDCNPFAVNSTAPTPNIKVYPNPFMNNLYIDHPKSTLESVKIYSPLGKELLSTQQNSIDGLNHLPKGLYYIHIHINNDIIITKPLLKN